MKNWFAWVAGLFALLLGFLGIQTARVKSAKEKVKAQEEVIQFQDERNRKQVEVVESHGAIVEKVLEGQDEIEKHKKQTAVKIAEASKEVDVEKQLEIGDSMFADWNTRNKLSDSKTTY